MLLSDRDIRAAHDEGHISLDPWTPEMVQPASIDVRLDRFFRLFNNHAYTYVDPAENQGALDSMQVTVGISPEGVLWPDDSRNAHLIVMLGVPAMVTGYLTTMQKLLRWHKNAPLGPNGEWTGDEASLLASLQQALQ